jgi:hypothetical protein
MSSQFQTWENNDDAVKEYHRVLEYYQNMARQFRQPSSISAKSIFSKSVEILHRSAHNQKLEPYSSLPVSDRSKDYANYLSLEYSGNHC